ncbi:MAG: PQQ-like beta-propeller repeat protein [Planctomycetia bacterium]|nr:PQQ-like beta-propeller repeat protein [Planctomycetia bacterium]
MSVTEEAPKGNPLLLKGAVAALLVLGGWVAYPYLNNYAESLLFDSGGDYRINSQVLQKLEKAPLQNAAVPVAVSGDWPQYRGPRRDGISLESGLLEQWPAEGPPVLWKVAGGPGFSTMSVAGGRVYTAIQADDQHEAIVCLYESTGEEIWRHRYPGHFTEPFSGVGPRSTPTVTDGKVYAVGSRGQFFCLDAQTGAVVWQTDLLQTFKAEQPEYGYSFSPLVDGDLVFVQPGGNHGNSIAALDRRDGKLVWKAFDDRPGYSSPIVAEIGGKRQVVCLTAEHALGFALADGKLFWKFSWPCFRDCNVASPIAAGDYVFISSGYNRGCGLLEITAGPDGNQQAKSVYEHNRMRNHFSTCVLHQEHLYGFDDNFLVCMALRTGKVLWKQRGYDKGTLLLANNQLIILGERGKLALADASPEAFKLRSQFQITDTRCWSMPVLANGKLFVRDEATIWCLDLRAGKP